MAIHIGSNFLYQSRDFLDSRISEATTLQDLKNWTTPVPEGFEVYCEGQWYEYNSRSLDPVTGKFVARGIKSSIELGEIKDKLDDIVLDTDTKISDLRGELESEHTNLEGKIKKNTTDIGNAVSEISKVSKTSEARHKVLVADTFSDLLNESSWTIDGVMYAKTGIVVSVISDSDPKKNSTYRLVSPNYKKPESWVVLVDSGNLIKAGDLDTPSENTNVLSALASDGRYLRKNTAEQIPESWTFQKDLSVGGDLQIGPAGGGVSYTPERGTVGKFDVVEAETSNIRDLGEHIFKSVKTGMDNLLRNSSFAGEYQSTEMGTDLPVGQDTRLFSESSEFWSGRGTWKVQEDLGSVTGFSVQLKAGSLLSQEITETLIPDEYYVLSYKAKGNILVNFDGQTYTSDNTEYEIHEHIFRYSGNYEPILSITGTGFFCEPKLERGTISTSWFPAVLDTDPVAGLLGAYEYLRSSFKEYHKGLSDGIFLQNILRVGENKDSVVTKETGGLSGIHGETDSIFTWSGCSYEEASKIVSKMLENPNYVPEQHELLGLSGFIVTHGGLAYLNARGKFQGRFETSRSGSRTVLDPSDGSIKVLGASDNEVLKIAEKNGKISIKSTAWPRSRTPENEVYVDSGGALRIEGDSGSGVILPDWKTYAYKMSTTKPTKPTGQDILPSGWSDYPNSAGQWWQSIGTVSGETGKVKVWSEVLQVNGQNGSNGQDGADGSDGGKGDQGDAGDFTEFRFALGTVSAAPVLASSTRNPSGWTVLPPETTTGKFLWMTKATITSKDVLKGTWSDPVRISGEDGKPGTTPNWKTYVYKMADSKPAKPSGNALIPSGWSDYPNTSGNWWQCVGDVNGATSTVTTWSEVLPLNGRDGEAQDGKFTEFRFAKNTSATSSPSIVTTQRTPAGWNITPPGISGGEYMWMTRAIIAPDDTLIEVWSTPVRISGEKGATGNTGPAGKDGPTGKDGASGLPGISFEIRYSLGTDNTYDATWNTTIKGTRNPAGWSLTLPETTSSKPQIWFIQARIEYSSSSDSTGSLQGGSWSNPSRLNGTTGLSGKDGSDGAPGKKGQVVYPAGLYSKDTAYTTDDNAAPYVLDPLDGQFYVLNAIMTWKGSEQASGNQSPSENFAQAQGRFWLKFNSFEAVYAKVGVIANGLIGSAVFNGDYMFSQQGVDASGVSTMSYEKFGTSEFTPNYSVNFASGEVNMMKGTVAQQILNKFNYIDLTLPENDSYMIDPNGKTNIMIVKSDITDGGKCTIFIKLAVYDEYASTDFYGNIKIINMSTNYVGIYLPEDSYSNHFFYTSIGLAGDSEETAAKDHSNYGLESCEGVLLGPGCTLNCSVFTIEKLVWNNPYSGDETCNCFLIENIGSFERRKVDNMPYSMGSYTLQSKYIIESK